MQNRLLLLLLLLGYFASAQRGFVYVKKKGFKKVRTFSEGEPIHFRTVNDQVIYGPIAFVKGDSISVNRLWYPVSTIKEIILKEKKEKEKSGVSEFSLITAGVAISTAGMTLANWASFPRALAYSAVIGYGNYLIKAFPKMKRKKYRIGRKYSLQTLDLHF